jgi:hypothetical protein
MAATQHGCALGMHGTLQVLSGHRPELPGGDIDDEDTHGTQQPPTINLIEVPASLSALPKLNAIIRDCWQQREQRRPSAAAVHDRLLDLMREYGLSPPPPDMP